MTNNTIEFGIRYPQALGQPAALPVGYKNLGVHIVFDVKIDTCFTRKVQIVSDRYKQDAPNSMTYSSAVSRDSVRITLTLAALNGLNLLTNNVQNTYLNAKPI